MEESTVMKIFPRFAIDPLMVVILVGCGTTTQASDPTAIPSPSSTAITITQTAKITTLTATAVPSAIPLSTLATPYPEEWLAFLKQGSEYWDDQTLFFATSAGSTVIRPGFFETYQGLPGAFLTWSPNGRFLQFDGGGHDPQLYLFDSVERTISSVSPGPINSLAYLGKPSWSPDSEHFVAALPVTLLQGGAEKGFDLFIYTVNTQEYARLTTNPFSDSYPTWSPDGQWISFFRYMEDERGCGPLFPSRLQGCNQVELYMIRPDGSDLTRLLESAYLVHIDEVFDLPHNTSSWSPDSQWLAMLTGTDQPDITLVSIESGETRVLAGHPALDIYPTWSPDGSKLAFVSDREGNREIYLISPDGTGHVNLTNNPAYDSNPVWSPSGGSIAFLSNRDGGLGLYVMDADGSNPMKIGESSVISQPVWFPIAGVDMNTLFSP